MVFRDRNEFVLSLTQGMVCAEIGVLCGEFSEVIAETQPKELWLIDCWECPPHYSNDAALVVSINQSYLKHYKAVLDKFTQNEVRVFRAYSVDAALLFPDGYFDLVYIDANHWRCDEDIGAWWRTVVPGGVLSGHDYGDKVKHDVDSFVEHNALELTVTVEVNPTWIVRKP